MSQNLPYCMHQIEIKHSDGVNSDAFVIIALDRGLVIIGGTHYAGEIKKAIFTCNLYFHPRVYSQYCSANTDGEKSALFFGLSRLGKTALSAIQTERSLAMMNMDGLTKEYSISKVGAMRSLFAFQRKTNLRYMPQQRCQGQYWKMLY